MQPIQYPPGNPAQNVRSSRLTHISLNSFVPFRPFLLQCFPPSVLQYRVLSSFAILAMARHYIVDAAVLYTTLHLTIPLGL